MMKFFVSHHRRPQSYLAPRSGEREGPGAQRREGEGHPRYLFDGSAREIIHQHTMNGARNLQGAVFKAASKPLTFPLLRNGPLPLPAMWGEVFSAHAARLERRTHQS